MAANRLRSRRTVILFCNPSIQAHQFRRCANKRALARRKGLWQKSRAEPVALSGKGELSGSSTLATI